MSESPKTQSEQAMQAEWQEVQAAQHDLSAFRPLYNRYYEAIFRFVFRRTADENTTADICSQVFLKAMQKLSQYSYQGVPFSAWLYRIASNEVVQHFRNTKKQRVVSLDDSHIENIMDEITPDDNRYDSAQLRQAFLDSLQALRPDDLELIEMRFFEQRPFKEIADLLDMTESNAKVKTYRILERLKKGLQKSKNR